MFEKINVGRAILAGLAGTAVMTVLMLAAPMMGAGLFRGSAMVAAGSLVGHLVYGALLGAVYGHAAPARLARTAHGQA